MGPSAFVSRDRGNICLETLETQNICHENIGLILSLCTDNKMFASIRAFAEQRDILKTNNIKNWMSSILLELKTYMKCDGMYFALPAVCLRNY